MAQGKFSNPRPHRDEERQIEETFRQLTGKESPRKPMPRDIDIPLEEVFEKPLDATSVVPQVPGTQQPPQEIPVQTPYQPRHEAPKADNFEIQFDDDFFMEDPEPPEPDFLDKAWAFVNENKKLVLAFSCAAALFLLVLVFSIFFLGGGDSGSNTILENVYLADIPVGGLTKNEAANLVKQSTSQTYSKQAMVIDLAGQQLLLSPKDTDAQLDVKAAVDAAYAYGRTGTEEQQEQAQQNTQPHVIALLPYLELDKDYIRDTLRAYAEDAGSTLTQTSYGLEGTQPELSAEKFNENAPTQILVITMGTPGIGFDYQDVYNQVLDAYSLHQFAVTVEDVESVKEPEPIDLEAIYEEFYIEPVDAKLDMQSYEVIPGSYGYGFDLEQAQLLVDNAQFGDELRIPMEYIAPEILEGDNFFQDVLGESTISHTSSKDRNKNLRLACDSINSTVLNPGEQFSFNAVVGNRTSGNGYKSALEVIRKDSEEDEEIIGGGVSQVASALYQSALLSDLQIDYRVNQDLAPGYIAAGLDAWVDWRSPDLQFTNNTGFPIQLNASATDGKVTIQILGTDERTHYIKLETKTTATQTPGTKYEDYEFDNDEDYEDGDVIRDGIQGSTVKTYKCKYDKSSGELLSRDFEATSQYKAVDKIVARVEPEETTEATTEPTTEPTTQPTEPPATEAPTVPAEEPTEPTTPATKPTEPPVTQLPTEETIPPVETEAPTPETEPSYAADPDEEAVPEGNDIPSDTSGSE